MRWRTADHRFSKRLEFAVQPKYSAKGCLSGQSLRFATAAAMTDCVIMRFDKAAIVRVLREEPKFSEMFLSYILVRNARVEADLVDQREAAGEVASSDGEFR
jgi:CRP-like cAMP-binding protein